jgi:hypothetical protein
MKKIILILLIVFGLSVFNITQASAGCSIVYAYTGYWSSSVPTLETSRTPQAAQELYNLLPYPEDCLMDYPPAAFSNNCYGFLLYGMRGTSRKWVCTDGSWELGCTGETMLCRIIDCTIYSGDWDVVCDNTTTTIIPTTTTTIISTVIELSSFTATPKTGKIILQWNTEAETDNAGFNIYRSTSRDDEYIKTNSILIPAKGSSTLGASYEFTDTNVQNRKTYYYKLEDIDLSGNSTMHGPVSATPRLIYGLKK